MRHCLRGSYRETTFGKTPRDIDQYCCKRSVSRRSAGCLCSIEHLNAKTAEKSRKCSNLSSPRTSPSSCFLRTNARAIVSPSFILNRASPFLLLWRAFLRDPCDRRLSSPSPFSGAQRAPILQCPNVIATSQIAGIASDSLVNIATGIT